MNTIYGYMMVRPSLHFTFVPPPPPTLAEKVLDTGAKALGAGAILAALAVCFTLNPALFTICFAIGFVSALAG